MKNVLLFIALSSLSFLFTSCESTAKAEKTADKFFSYVIKGQLEKAAELTSIAGVNNMQLQQGLSALRNGNMGLLKSAEKGAGFNTSINNGVTNVKLNYTLTYQRGETNVEVVVTDQGSGFKVSQVQ